MLASALMGFGCVGLAGTGYFLPHLQRYTNARALQRQATRTRSLVLTYDDGPGAVSTPRLLSLLHARQAVATFFLVGRQAEAHPALVEQVRAAGHEIGCHTYSHCHAWKVAPWTASRDVDRGYAALASSMSSSGVFRPPYGKITLATWLNLRWRHAPVALWTADSGDTHAVLPKVNVVVDRIRAAGGGVVLLHDFDRTQDRIDFVLAVTDALLDLAAHEHMHVRKLGELWPT